MMNLNQQRRITMRENDFTPEEIEEVTDYLADEWLQSKAEQEYEMQRKENEE